MTDMQDRLTDLLSDFSGLRLAILFGSHAYGGEAGPESDIDLGLLVDAPIQAEEKRKLIEAIAGELGRSVDIVDLYYAPEPILGEVFKGQRLLGDDETYAQLLTRHLIESADFLPLRQRILSERRKAWID